MLTTSEGSEKMNEVMTVLGWIAAWAVFIGGFVFSHRMGRRAPQSLTQHIPAYVGMLAFTTTMLTGQLVDQAAGRQTGNDVLTIVCAVLVAFVGIMLVVLIVAIAYSKHKAANGPPS